MSSFLLTPAAQGDLDDIYDFTVERWGEAQAERYVSTIRAACEGLASGTRQGRTINDVRPGYLKLAVGSHFLFFRKADDTIEIVRILHQRMDVPSHL